MPPKIFINFLGANEYAPCNYELNGIKIENVRFVQEALVQILDKQEPFTAEDKIITFVTEDANKNNWQNSTSRITKEPLEGLASRFARLELPLTPEPVAIPEGFSEEQIWEIFRIVYESIPERSVVYFDITHAFRFLPMLGMVLINYARFLKEIEVGGIYYGAFEKLGPAYKVKEMPLTERNAPILELTSLSLLNDWTNAANNFFQYGRAEGIEKIVNTSVASFFKEKGEHQRPAILIGNIARGIAGFTNEVITNRGKNIVEGNSPQRVIENLNSFDQFEDILPAFTPLLDKIKNRLQKYKPSTLSNAYYALEWAVEHNWAQQAVTQMDEFLVSFMLEQLGIDWENKTYRKSLNKAVQIVSLNTEEQEWKANEEQRRLIKEIKPKLEANERYKELMAIMNSIDGVRNSLNHGGYNQEDNYTSKTIQANLENNFKELTQILKTHWPDFLSS
jgi:CRISPR-associated Csx2 family protein